MEMSELSMPSTAKKTQFSGIFVPLFIFLCSFLLSKFSYFISFLPYILKLLYFLSPLILTTFLVFLFTSYRTVIDNARKSNNDGDEKEELGSSNEEHEVYKIFFEASQFEGQHHKEDGLEESEELVDKFLICVDNGTSVSEDQNALPEKTLEELFQEKEECETVVVLQVVEEIEKEVKQTDTDSKNIIWGSKEELGKKVKEEEGIEEVIKVSAVSGNGYVSRTPQSTTKVLENSIGEEAELCSEVGEQEFDKMSLSTLGSFGSMRREKEWKRTLACKLFEERHNNGNGGEGDEGMDLLWETYENDSSTNSLSSSSSTKKSKGEKKLEKKRAVGSGVAAFVDEDDNDDEEEEEEDEEMGGKFCCLQALKFSAGKVNLGMGRPNIARISKAFRGIGWLHHVSSKHHGSKKGSPLKPTVLFG